MKASKLTRSCNWILGLGALAAFVLFVHNYGFSLLPAERIPMLPARMQPIWKFSYVYSFDGSQPDLPLNWRNRTEILENGEPLQHNRIGEAEVQLVGGGRWLHEPGRLIFTTTDNSDPRKNGRSYILKSPIFYTERIGRTAGGILLFCVLGLYALNRPQNAVRSLADKGVYPTKQPRWRLHLAGATLLFLFGLYCNTGTLTPYAVTTIPHVDKATGYLYNGDHVHFKVLFSFVDNAHRSVWNHALLLRRILYPVIAYPLMKLFGFEIGGTLMSLLLNITGFVLFLCWLRRRVGERGAIFAGWILAISPGATYWGGMPYPYALIFPGSLMLMAGMVELSETADGRVAAVLSLAMGVLYLGYDFAVFFLPASLLLLLWKGRFRRAAVSLVLQALPLAIWLWVMSAVLKQSLENSNTGVYHQILVSYSRMTGAQWGSALATAWDAGGNVLFGANFIFLPALFVLVVVLNPLTSRIRFRPAEICLLLSVLGVFLLNNLAPAYGGWDMHGSWVSRLYQPVFAAFILFMARWWQDLPPRPVLSRIGLKTVAVLAIAGNALIVFGPILDNPFKLSEFAFYRFYNHSEAHEDYTFFLNTEVYKRRPLGFPKPQP